jgi:hypothetical protein
MEPLADDLRPQQRRQPLRRVGRPRGPVTGTYRAGFDSVDGIHISALGHNALATAFVSQYAGRLTTDGTQKPRTNVDSTNLLSNGLMLTIVDSTPNVPDSWTWRPGTSGAVGTIAQDTDFQGGNAFQVVRNQPSAASELLQNASNVWSAGDVLLMTCKVKVVSASGLSSTNGVRADAYFFGGSPQSARVARGVRLGGLEGTIAKRVTVSPGTTTIQFYFGFTADPAAYASFRVAEFAIYNLTRLGLV